MASDEKQETGRTDIPKIQPLRKPFSVTAVSVLGIFILGLFYTFYFARDFFLPVTLAAILSLLLSPLVRLLNRAHIPSGFGAAIVMIIVAMLVSAGAMLLVGPASNWLQRAPESFEKVEVRLRGMMNSAEKLTKAAETVEHLAGTENETPKVEIKKPGLINSLWDQTKGFVLLALEVFVLLYFFLAAGEIFALKLIQVLPRLQDKKKAVEIMRQVQNGVSQYLVSMTLVNLFEGTMIGIGLALLGMPNPLLWGVLAFLANYIPYVGAMVAGSIVTIVALVSFDSVSRAMIAPAIYFGVNFADNFISPYVMGRRLVLNPLVVFLAVMFWGWIWGIIGVLLAVPITMTGKILCDHVPALAPFAEFLTAARSEKPEAGNGAEIELAKGNA
jgi:predicted PurR-regulated permease PerM